MLDGVITGGWSYVIAAYGITVAALAVYVWTLGARRRKLEALRARREVEE